MAERTASQKTESSVKGSQKGAKRKPGKSKDQFVDKVMSCRHEMKYVISESKTAAMVQFLRQYIDLDRYCKLQRGGIYPICSLYLDSPSMLLCRESIAGKKNRFKLRIRSYTDEPDYPRFFEIKRRVTTVINKSRARVMEQDVGELLRGRPLPPQDYTTDEAALNQFQLYMKNIAAAPKVLIRYYRQAFEGEGENRVRVTFDRDLCYCVTDEPVVRLGGGGWQRNKITEGRTILEIKFTGNYPAWLDRMVKYFDIKTRSVSKYATSIEQACEKRFCAPILMR